MIRYNNIPITCGRSEKPVEKTQCAHTHTRKCMHPRVLGTQTSNDKECKGSFSSGCSVAGELTQQLTSMQRETISSGSLTSTEAVEHCNYHGLDSKRRQANTHTVLKSFQGDLYSSLPQKEAQRPRKRENEKEWERNQRESIVLQYINKHSSGGKWSRLIQTQAYHINREREEGNNRKIQSERNREKD